jgi:molybdate transport system permease protein
VSLLIFFQTFAGKLIERSLLTFTFAVPGIVLAQTLMGTGFAIRIIKLAFDGVSPKRAGVARTLGATRWQAFWRVELAEARRGLVEAFFLAWATAFGTFGPVILLCGTTRLRTEVLSTSIFLEFSIGNLDRALILSIWMGVVASAVVLVVRGRARRPLW